MPSRPTPVTGHGGGGPLRRRRADKTYTRPVLLLSSVSLSPSRIFPLSQVHLQQPRHGWPLQELLPPLQFVRVVAPQTTPAPLQRTCSTSPTTMTTSASRRDARGSAGLRRHPARRDRRVSGNDLAILISSEVVMYICDSQF